MFVVGPLFSQSKRECDPPSLPPIKPTRAEAFGELPKNVEYKAIRPQVLILDHVPSHLPLDSFGNDLQQSASGSAAHDHLMDYPQRSPARANRNVLAPAAAIRYLSARDVNGRVILHQGDL